MAPATATAFDPKKVTDLDSVRAARVAARAQDEHAVRLLGSINACKDAVRQEMQDVEARSDRFDRLYYAEEFSAFGADHHSEDIRKDRNHISLNTFHAYVDIPAALLAVPPIENILPTDPGDPDLKELATIVERMYFAWKFRERWEMKCHKLAVAKGLYGRAAVKVHWDEDDKRPCVSVIDQPRNLWLGWSSTDYTKLDWGIYVYRMTPTAVTEEFGLDVGMETGEDGMRYPVVKVASDVSGWTVSSRGQNEFGMIEVHDFWYRRPKRGARLEKGKKTPMETWNAILVGNVVIKDEAHPEYDGHMPYVPLFNTYIPGVPDGKSNLHDVEQLIREKEQRLEAGGDMIGKAVDGQMWQLTGQEAPDRVPTHVKPKPNTVIAPGAGNRVEKIEPFVPAFQHEQHMDRLDREAVVVTGLNDLLLGLAPAQVLSSSKAISTLVANYETRMAMGRDMYYDFRISTWELVKVVWGSKDSKLKRIFEVASRLSIKNPSLTPRDDVETAQIAGNLVQQKLWSNARAMDAVGVEDPEAEQEVVKTESMDASLYPDRVQVVAAVLATLQQLGVDPRQLLGAQGGGQDPAALGDAAAASSMAANGGVNNQPTGEAMPAPMQPANAQDAAMAGLLAGPQATGPGFNAVSQAQIKNGDVSNRLLLQQPIGPQGGA